MPRSICCRFRQCRAVFCLLLLVATGPLLKRLLGRSLQKKELIGNDDMRGLSVLNTFAWMSHGSIGQMTGYHAENEELAERVDIRARVVPPMMIIAFIVGFALAHYFVLGSYYQ